MYLINSLNKKIAFHRIIRLRHRYLFTRTNKLRLRYIAGTAVIVSMTLTSFLGSMGTSVAFVPGRSEIAEIKDVIILPDPDIKLASVSETQKFIDQDNGQLGATYEESYIEKATAPLLLPEGEVGVHVHDSSSSVFVDTEELVGSDLKQEKLVMGPVRSQDLSPREEIIKINPGDTVSGALQAVGVSAAEAYRAVKAMSKHYDPRSIKPGQAISAHFEPGRDGMELAELNMKISPIKELVILRDEHERFKSILNKKEVVLKTKAAKASIETSLYGSAARVGIPASIVAEMIRIYSYDVDFQRDIRQGDKVEILYEIYETVDGDFARYGDVLYANLMVGGKKIPVYRYEPKDGITDYYRENGMSLKRILMQTPIDGARMSSGFGMRRHPVLGYNKMHKGIDFAAPRGTPIYAAGNGVIEKAGRNGGYGNYIRIRHNNGLKTAYAHMHKFAVGMKAGKRVEQSQIIGYVGTTGRSTGPHLHFEVMKNGKQVNPKSIKSSSGEKLAGKKLEEFQAKISQIKKQYAKLGQELKFAQNDL